MRIHSLGAFAALAVGCADVDVSAESYEHTTSTPGAAAWRLGVSSSGDERQEVTHVATIGASAVIGGLYRRTATIEDTGVRFLGGDDDELFVARIDPEGDVVWARQFPHVGADRLLELAASPAGDVYLLTRGGIDFGCGTPPGELLVTRLDASGSCVWSEAILGAARPDLAAAPDGGLIVAGEFATRVELFGDVLVTGGADDTELFVASVTAAGDLRWIVQHGEGGGASGIDLADVAVDGHGHVALTGTFARELDLGAGAMLAADGRGFVARLRAASGATHWTRQLAPDRSPRRIAAGESGVIAVAGVRADGDDLDAFVWKLSAYGRTIWMRNAAGTAEWIVPHGVSVDHHGNVGVALEAAFGTVVVGGTHTASEAAMIVASFAPTSGTTKWARALTPARGGSLPLDLAVTSNGRLVVVGRELVGEEDVDGFVTRFLP